MFSVLLKRLKYGSYTEQIQRDGEFEAIGNKIKEKLAILGKKSLQIRAVDAGSANDCEHELIALENPVYDIGRFGLRTVASPRHADILMVTGCVTKNMELAVKRCYEAAAEPKIVIAIGDAAIDGGVYKGSYAVAGGVKDVIPVDLEIAGDPPTPTQILTGIFTILDKLS